MIKKVVSLTADGKVKLEKELEELIARRPEVAERLATARAFGDLSENQEYSDARAEQKAVENRIFEIQDILKNAKVIRGAKHTKVGVGAKVKVKTGKKELEYEIVSPVEADPLAGRISDQSPIGKAMLGRKAGEEFELKTQMGSTKYTVISVE